MSRNADMSSRRSRLCAICQEFDVQALLLAAEAAPSSPNTNRVGSLLSVKPGVIRDAIPKYFTHQPSLTSLKISSKICDLCSAIWKDYARQRRSSELTGAALTSGLASEQIYTGTLDWDTGASAVPNVVVSQYSSSSAICTNRQLACFEVCAVYGMSPYIMLLSDLTSLALLSIAS